MQTKSPIDLTQGPVFKTLFRLAAPITISMVIFTVYLLVDLYFAGRLGPDAVAAVSIAGNALFIHLDFSTILGTGGMVLIAQAFGRKDFDLAANLLITCRVVGDYGTAALASLGVGKTYPSLMGALIDNLLFAALVFTLPSIFEWEIQSVWWIKISTVIIETTFVAVWLRWELRHVRVALELKPQPT